MDEHFWKKIRNGWNRYNVLACLGFLATLLYLYVATTDVVYSDYIRLILSYIKNAWDIRPYLGLDVFTRMPINYIQRLVNVTVFGYSTTFDMVLGACCLFLSALVLSNYSKRMKLSYVWYLLLMAVLFSLNKWEMLTNGSGWVHFMAFAMFFWHYACIEEEYHQRGNRANNKKLIIIPIVTILFVAGPYSGTYALTVLLAYAYIGFLRAWGQPRFFEKLWLQIKVWIVRALAVILPLMMYIFSRIHSVEDHAGATSRGFVEVFLESPMLFPKFFLKTFASMFIGKEYASRLQLSNILLHLLGLLLIGFYLYAFWIQFHFQIRKRTILPMMLMLSGVMNHLIITLSRWIFLKDPLYAMSSRYALQFQVGLLGIILTMAWQKKMQIKYQDNKVRSKRREKKIQEMYGQYKMHPLHHIMAMVLFILLGVSQLFFFTTEWRIAKYRKVFFLERMEVAREFEQRTDEEIKQYMQYRSVDKTREALRILQSQKLNVFRE